MVNLGASLSHSVSTGRLSVALPVLIVIIALILRLTGLNWDDGHFFHPDERSIYMRAHCMYQTLSNTPGWEYCANKDFPLDSPGLPSLGTLLDEGESPLNPHWFPLGSILIYILVLAKFFLGIFMNSVNLSDLATFGRSLTILIDTASVLLLYLLGKRMYGSGTGLLASALGAVSVFSIQASHFYRPEPFVVLFYLTTFWLMLNAIQRDRWKDHLYLGIAVGVCFAFKPTSLLLLPPLILTYLTIAIRSWRYYHVMIPEITVIGVGIRALLSGFIAFLTFGLLEPYALLDFSKFTADLNWENDIARTAGLVPYTMQYIGAPKVFYEVQQTTLWALGLPLGIIAWVGPLAAVVRLWSNVKISDALLLSWVIPYILVVSLFEVKFLRYMIPVLPVMILLGSHWLISTYAWTGKRWHLGKPFVGSIIVIVLLTTTIFGLAFSNIFSKPHPAVQASQWVHENVSHNTLILTDNHWDEGFPGLHRYSVTQLPMYDGDTIEKAERLAENLAEADYLMMYSNRPFGSIARLPDRYPVSSKYYRTLFAGELGYKPIATFARHASLFNVAFVHNPFTRAGVDPIELNTASDASIRINLGYADGNVTNYDRPLVLIFKNEAKFTPAELLNRMAGIDDSLPVSEDAELSSSALIQLFGSSEPAEIEPLMLSKTTWAYQRSEGSWRDIFSETGPTTWVPPWVLWLLVVQLITFATLPITISLFRWLPDRGIALARPFGLLLVAWLTWISASIGIMDFSKSSILLAILLVCCASSYVAYRNRGTILPTVRQHLKYFLGLEALFLLAFLAFLIIRSANPDLWHPWRGGEKPMDLAYLTAIVKSSTMPPYDPWYAGGYINYYYFGQFMIGVLVKVTGIIPAIAYNLAIPLLFGLTVTGSFSIGYNTTETLRRSNYPKMSGYSTITAGIITAILVTVIGNFDGALQIIANGWQWINGEAITQFDYWRSSRMMPGQIAITEFPFWSFLFADLHSHVISIPFTLMTLGLILNLVLSNVSGVRPIDRIPPAIMTAFSVGALAGINTWDIPTYGLIAVGGGIILMATMPGPFTRERIAAFLATIVGLGLVAYLLFLPFHLHYDSNFAGLKMSPERTSIWNYLAIHGLMLFLISSWIVKESFGKFSKSLPAPEEMDTGSSRNSTSLPWIVFFALLAISIIVISIPAELTTVTILCFLSLFIFALTVRWLSSNNRNETGIQLFLLLLIGMALLTSAAVDIVSLENDIGRMNTVFKFYIQVWVLMALASGIILWLFIANHSAKPASRGRFLNKTWLTAIIFLAVGSLIFPILGTQARLADRFQPLPLTLDGSQYQRAASYQDPGPDKSPGGLPSSYPLISDRTALEYMQNHIIGSPVILEAVTDQYRWTPRVASYTGLPVVMGWEWHQTQQRGPTVRNRMGDVDTMYSTVNEDLLIRLLDKYEVEYIYVGPVENLYYPRQGLAKFKELVGSRLEIFYQSESVTIYKLVDSRAP